MGAPGFEKRLERTRGTDEATIERWTPQQVEAATVYYGHAPTAQELREHAAAVETNN